MLIAAQACLDVEMMIRVLLVAEAIGTACAYGLVNSCMQLQRRRLMTSQKLARWNPL